MVLILILTTAFYLPALPMILLPWEVETSAICLDAPIDDSSTVGENRQISIHR